jgi:hypothetical protein
MICEGKMNPRFEELTSEELFFAKILGTKRFQESQRLKRLNPKWRQYTDNLEAHIEGVMCELVFCKMFGVYPDTTTNPRSGGCDCVYRGHRVDIKGSMKRGRELLIVPAFKQPGQTDIFVLMLGEGQRFRFAGWAWESDVMTYQNTCIAQGFDMAPYELKGNPWVLHESRLRKDWDGLGRVLKLDEPWEQPVSREALYEVVEERAVAENDAFME